MIRVVIKSVAKSLLAKGASKYLPKTLQKIYETKGTAAQITLPTVIFQKILGFNRHAYWPCHFTSVISSPDCIEIGIGTAPGLSPNCYIQGASGIKIGDYSLVGPGVGLITNNHDIYDIHSDQPSAGIVIGKYCWIGMNAVILPGVRLGDHTVVAAGAVVTKSFPLGFCVLGGIPARVVKTINRGEVIKRLNNHQYIGYYGVSDFLKARPKILSMVYNQGLDAFVPFSSL